MVAINKMSHSMHSREILPARKITSIAAMLALLWIFGVSGTANAAVPIVEFTKVKQGEVFPWPLVVIEGKTTEGVMERLQSIHEDFKCLYIKPVSYTQLTLPTKRIV